MELVTATGYKGEALGAVTQSVEHRPRVWEIASSVPGQVKPMTHHFLDRHSALIGHDKDCLALCLDNVTE